MASRSVLAVGVILVVLAIVMAYYYFQTGPSGASPLGDERVSDLLAGSPASIDVQVNAIGSDGGIVIQYTCVGRGIVPRVEVSNIPSNVEAVALIVYDPDAPRGTFIHWLAVARASGSSMSLPVEGMVEGLNSGGRIGYYPPCPPPGDKPHHYYFLVVGFDSYPPLSSGFSFDELLYNISGHVVAYGYVVGTFSR